MTSEKIVYLMRGLSCSGKSHTARELAGDAGIVCETNQFSCTQVGSGEDLARVGWPAVDDHRDDAEHGSSRWAYIASWCVG
jgi:hypothetical protein